MTIYFKNNCIITVVICIDEITFKINPYEIKSVNYPSGKQLYFSVYPDKKSGYKNGIYNLVLKTQYIFNNISNFQEFSITHEKIRFSIETSYERLFITSENVSCSLETSSVYDEEYIKKRFDKNQKLRFLIQPFECNPTFIILLLFIGVVLSYFWGVSFAILYYPIICFLIYFGNWIFNIIFNKVFKNEDKKEFYEFCTCNYIDSYFSNSNREPFMNNRKKKD